MSNPILSKLNVGERSPGNRTYSSRSMAERTSFLRFVRRQINSPWLACIPLTALIIVVWNAAAIAQDVEINEVTVEVVNESVATLQGYLNTIWILVASVLVIFMNAGFGMLETGLCRQKNAVNILTKNLIVFALATVAYWALGFSFMFGAGDSPNAFIGLGGFFLSGESATYGLDPFPGGLPVTVFFLFQVAFSATAATIVSGAVAERIKFNEFLIFSVLLVGIAYPITGHWTWGGGWLSSISILGAEGFSDFAGSTVVHSVGGWAALVGASLLGPRIGKFVDGRPGALPGHNMGFAMLGCLILWIGWFGFNPGSELAANENCAYIAVTTNLAASAGGITATFTSWLKDGKPDLSMVINGILAGLVGITAGCAGVDYWGAIIIGGVAGILVVYSVAFFDSIKIDDPVGAISVHLVNGVWGTLAVGLFATEGGLFYGGGVGQLIIQFIGVAATGAFTVAFSLIVWTILKQIMGIRVSKEEELIGLDISEHGMQAYTGFVTEVDSYGSSTPMTE